MKTICGSDLLKNWPRKNASRTNLFMHRSSFIEIGKFQSKHDIFGNVNFKISKKNSKLSTQGFCDTFRFFMTIYFMIIF